MQYIQLISLMFLIDRTISDDSKEHDSTSFEEQDSADHSHKLPHAPEKSPSTRFVDLFLQLLVKNITLTFVDIK